MSWDGHDYALSVSRAKAAIALPSVAEQCVAEVSIRRQRDDRAGLIAFHVSTVTLPTAAGGIQIGVGGYPYRDASLLAVLVYALEASPAFPNARVAVCGRIAARRGSDLSRGAGAFRSEGLRS